MVQRVGRKLTDSEVFGFSQVNSEHCRHKIFNGKFIIDGKEKPSSLFDLIRKTSKENPNTIVGQNSLLRSHSIIYAGTELGDNFNCGHRVTIREFTVAPNINPKQDFRINMAENTRKVK